MKKTFKLLMLALLSTFALASCEDVPAPYPNPNPDASQSGGSENQEIAPAGDGTIATPYNVAAVVEYCNNLGSDVESEKAVYIKGKVASNTTTESTISQYGNMTFTIIDEGNTKTTFTAFQVYGPGNKKFTSVDQIKEGDEVVVYGKVVNYKGNTPETVGKGAAYVVSINSQGGTDVPDTPSDAIEVTCAKAVELCAALADGDTSAETYSVTGYITDVFGTVSRNQQSFWMADTKDGGKVLQAYWANLPEGVEAFTKGSKVKITGQLLKYVKDGNVTTEIKNANVVILEGGNDTPDTPDTPGTPGEAKGDGSLNNPYNAAGASQYAASLGADKESSPVYIKGKVSRTTDISAQYGNATFFISEDGSQNGEFYVFRCLGLGNKKIASANDVKVGDEVIIYGPVINYKGNTPETVQNKAYIYSLNGNTEGGNTDQPGTDEPGTDTPSAATSLTNGGFEDWSSDTQPTGWKSASTASSAKLSKSTDAHGGSFSVKVTGDASSNKRLASQEITLEAGTYKFAFYAKATTADKSQARAGWVPVTDGKVGNYNYASYSDLTNSGWTLVEQEITLNAKTTLCLVVMNPKASDYSSGKDILIDDATLVKK